MDPSNCTPKEIEPDYDDLPRGDPNPLWIIAIAAGTLFAVFAAVVALT